MKKALSGFLCCVLLVSTLSVPAYAANEPTSFDDMDNYKWALENVMICVEKGAILGTRPADENGVGSFSPGADVTVGTFLTVLTRLLCPELIGTETTEHWAQPNWIAAVESGLIKASDFSCDKPTLDAPLRREDMAYLLVNAAKLKGEDLQIKQNVERAIADYSDITYDRTTDVKKAYSNGLLMGSDTGAFNPKEYMDRAQMATVVCRLMEYVPRATVTIPSENGSIISADKSEYVAQDGSLRRVYSAQYETEALALTRTGQDANGLYIIYTAPNMPDLIEGDFTFDFRSVMETANGNYWGQSINLRGLKPGESQKVYLSPYDGNTLGNLDLMTVTVSIISNTDKMVFLRTIYSSDKTHLEATYTSGSLTEIHDFDSTHVWEGLGL